MRRHRYRDAEPEPLVDRIARSSPGSLFPTGRIPRHLVPAGRRPCKTASSARPVRPRRQVDHRLPHIDARSPEAQCRTFPKESTRVSCIACKSRAQVRAAARILIVQPPAAPNSSAARPDTGSNDPDQAGPRQAAMAGSPRDAGPPSAVLESQHSCCQTRPDRSGHTGADHGLIQCHDRHRILG